MVAGAADHDPFPSTDMPSPHILRLAEEPDDFIQSLIFGALATLLGVGTLVLALLQLRKIRKKNVYVNEMVA